MPQGLKLPSLANGSAHQMHPSNERLITINVSGLHFQTKESVLSKYPNTLLGDRKRRLPFYHKDLDEFFFDRHRPSFDGIFEFYKTGKIRRPINVPLDVFLMELTNFDMGETVINQVLKQEGCKHTRHGEKAPNSEPRRTIWYLFERPESSILAGIVATLSCVITLLSVAGTCFQTLPQYRQKANNVTSDPLRFHAAFQDSFFCIETGCVSWFAFELGIRFYASTNKIKFVKDILNILDFLAILPYVVTLVLLLSNTRGKSEVSLVVVRIVRLVRILRVFKLTRHVTAMKILLTTIYRCRSALGTKLLFLLTGTVLFAGLAYVAESNVVGSKFSSIPESFWWAVVTMTTVGYGDVIPVTAGGKIAACACALFGLLEVSMICPIFIEEFENVLRSYSQDSVKILCQNEERTEKKLLRRPSLQSLVEKETSM
ncbi:potassium voltage-gated channel subfamily A member 10-like [Branchiostoma floridae]|uniref:Potassium voltage-gated channel subfamily A member 10-like n=1 Tax=Branchiostoma floridae TaxID=7739 RepID=C3XUL8_BRAFL|nr:potassium voltage-gated channel subfamily A member 10-like [Branchiostoma floridae]|eukprot:XP_002612208.1 hypothetical protein BRAFLDRAFT_100123 [Branchiostoma floridae]